MSSSATMGFMPLRRPHASSCRKRLGGLSFAQPDRNSRSRVDRRMAADGGSNDEDERRDGWCEIAVSVCLAIPRISENTGATGGCDPQAVRSIDFRGSVPLSADPGDWRSTEVANVSEAVKVGMVPAAVVSGRCVGGLKGKQCSQGADNECDRFLGDEGDAVVRPAASSSLPRSGPPEDRTAPRSP